MIMGWRSVKTIDIYDQSREGEAALSVLASHQQDLSQRHYAVEPVNAMSPKAQRQAPTESDQPEMQSRQEAETVWMHDTETLDWIKSMERQTRQQS
jgi:hypothetical protein